MSNEPVSRGPGGRRWSWKRKALLALGLAAFVPGVVLLTLGLISWLDEGEETRPETAVVDVGDVLLDITPAPTAKPAPPSPPLGDAPFRILIDKIGVDAPVAPYGLDASGVPLVPLGPDAAEVVAWYDFSAKPGTGSNAVFAGHVTWNGRAVFYDLQSLQPGDVVRLIGADGTELAYSVSSNFAVDPNDADSVKVMDSTESDVITLITCGGSYFRTSDPVTGGDYTQRVIVRADLLTVTPGAAQAAAAPG